MAMATQLASKEAFVEDPVLPLMIWYGIEPAVIGNPAKALELSGRPRCLSFASSFPED